MKINFAILGLVPLGVQEQVLGVKELFNFPGVEVFTVRDTLPRRQQIQSKFQTGFFSQRCGNQTLGLVLANREPHPPRHL
jgi:hypothetical protein